MWIDFLYIELSVKKVGEQKFFISLYRMCIPYGGGKAVSEFWSSHQ